MPSQALLQRGKKPYGVVMLFEEMSERKSGRCSCQSERFSLRSIVRAELGAIFPC
jgi:hypothetical protein